MPPTSLQRSTQLREKCTNKGKKHYILRKMRKGKDWLSRSNTKKDVNKMGWCWLVYG